jgi:uncharacterized protein YbjT (DUF2867 family)
MAVLQKVILVGGTGETGKEILKALLADGSYVSSHNSDLNSHIFPTTH